MRTYYSALLALVAITLLGENSGHSIRKGRSETMMHTMAPIASREALEKSEATTDDADVETVDEESSPADAMRQMAEAARLEHEKMMKMGVESSMEEALKARLEEADSASHEEMEEDMLRDMERHLATPPQLDMPEHLENAKSHMEEVLGKIVKGVRRQRNWVRRVVADKGVQDNGEQLVEIEQHNPDYMKALVNNDGSFSKEEATYWASIFQLEKASPAFWSGVKPDDLLMQLTRQAIDSVVRAMQDESMFGDEVFGEMQQIGIDRFIAEELGPKVEFTSAYDATTVVMKSSAAAWPKCPLEIEQLRASPHLASLHMDKEKGKIILDALIADKKQYFALARNYQNVWNGRWWCTPMKYQGQLKSVIDGELTQHLSLTLQKLTHSPRVADRMVAYTAIATALNFAFGNLTTCFRDAYRA